MEKITFTNGTETVEVDSTNEFAIERLTLRGYTIVEK